MDWWLDDWHRKDKWDICPDLIACKPRKCHDRDCESIWEHKSKGLCFKKKKHRKCKLIPIGRVVVDCTPVSFETRGQADTILFGPGCVTFTHIIP